MWKSRPVAAGLIRAFVFVAPVAAAVGASAVLARQLPAVSTNWGRVAWLPVFFTVATAVVFAVDRLVRRLLPLAALFKLSLAFPDRAPSRFRVALRAGNVHRLRARDVTATSTDESNAGAAAGHVLELATALQGHDRRTRGHSERVRAYTELIADELGLSEGDRHRLRWAALLHDIGKVAVPARILNKSEELTEEEWAAVRRHPEEGDRLVAPLAPWLGEWTRAVAEHHERFDGSGYPRGLRGDHVSRGGRIVAVADAFEVMTAARAYKRPLPAEEARRELARHAGSQFDPLVVRAFLNVSLGRLRRSMGAMAWIGQLPLLLRVPLAPGAVGTVAAATVVGGIVAAGGLAGIASVRSVEPEVLGIVEEGDHETQRRASAGGRSSGTENADSVPAGGDRQGVDSDSPTGSATDAADDREQTVGGASTSTTQVGLPEVETTLTVDLPGTETTLTVPGASTTLTVPSADTEEVNTPPLAVADAATTTLGQPVTVPVLANDVDADGDDLDLIGHSQALLQGASVARSGDSLVYTPGSIGVDTFSYTVSDGRGGEATGVVTVTVTAL